DAEAEADAIGAGAPPPAFTRRTVTAKPSPRRSFDSVTASRSGRLGRTTAPSFSVSADRPFAESFFATSAGAAPVTSTSYLSAALAPSVDGAGLAAGLA